MSCEGWTRSYRARWGHPIFRSFKHASMWVWLTDSAAWKDTRVRFCERVVELKRGQLVTSERFIAKGFEVNRIVVRKLLERLEVDHMIARQPTHGGTIITICNYEKYQSTHEGDRPPDSPRVAQDESTRSPNKKNLRKEEEESKKDSIPQNGFAEFWEVYPRKVDRGHAEKAFTAALRLTSLAVILEAARRYRDACRDKDRTFIAHPGTWLHGKRWLDEQDHRIPGLDRDRQVPQLRRPTTPPPRFPVLQLGPDGDD